MQNSDEHIPVIDFSEADQEDIDSLIYSVSIICEELATIQPVVIKIIKSN